VSIVLDTNVALDWLVFDDPSTRRLAQAITSGRLWWWSTAGMRAELAHMLVHPDLARWRPDSPAALAQFDGWSHLAAQVPEQRHPTLHCRDGDDQIFIDLAIASRARWLLSRDRAVLALAKAARAFGVEIMTPAKWNALPHEPGSAQAPPAIG
jgi:putative PIN family toxin of toxin-antitoxin system